MLGFSATPVERNCRRTILITIKEGMIAADRVGDRLRWSRIALTAFRDEVSLRGGAGFRWRHTGQSSPWVMPEAMTPSARIRRAGAAAAVRRKHGGVVFRGV